jgi:hypothetical protein
MSGLSAARQARVDALEHAAELLAVASRENADTAEALRKQLSENAAQNQRIADLQALNDSLKAREAANRPLLDVIEQSIKQLKEAVMDESR